MATGTEIFTVRIPTPLRKRLNKIAEAMERPGSWVVNRALEEFVAAQAWQIEEIRQAVVDADARDFATDEEVKTLTKKYKPRK